MKYDYIIRAVRNLKKRYKTAGPKEICRKLHIILNEVPMGTSPTAVKGFFIRNARKKVITINSDLPAVVQRFILAHELGHAVIHGNSVRMFNDITLYDESSPEEKEANIFAAELLMEDEEVLEHLHSGCTFFTAASILDVPPEFLDFKIRVMQMKGLEVALSPITSDSCFLKNIAIPDNHDYDPA